MIWIHRYRLRSFFRSFFSSKPGWTPDQVRKARIAY